MEGLPFRTKCGGSYKIVIFGKEGVYFLDWWRFVTPGGRGRLVKGRKNQGKPRVQGEEIENPPAVNISTCGDFA